MKFLVSFHWFLNKCFTKIFCPLIVVQVILSLFAMVALSYCQEYVIQSPYFVQQGHDYRVSEPYGNAYGAYGAYGGYGGYGAGLGYGAYY